MTVPLPLGADTFACGLVRYIDRYGDGTEPRLVIPVRYADQELSLAIVDTGAPWCIISPETADSLEIDRTLGYRLGRPLNVRGFRYNGWLCRISLRFEPLAGQGLDVETTVFIPDLPPDALWPLPNFIGLDGVLFRIHFAVDPAENLFHFGPL
jgi:hypothetical protein